MKTRDCLGNFDAESKKCMECPLIDKCTMIPDFKEEMDKRKKVRIISKYKEKRYIP
jgi:hypothetical protein